MEIPESKTVIHKGKEFVYLDHSAGGTYSIFGNNGNRILVDAQTGNVFHEYQMKKPETVAAPTQQS